MSTEALLEEKTLIEVEYSKLSNNNLSTSGICNVINNIIQIKIQEPSLSDVHQNLSVDIKQYINSLINQAELGSFGYDSIEVKKVEEILSEFTPKENLVLIDYFIRQLKKSSFEHEIKGFQKFKTACIIKQLLKRNKFYKPKNIWLLCIYFPQYSVLTLFVTFLVIGLIIAVILLPAPFNFMGVLNFDISYYNFSSHFFINHILNLFGAFVGIGTDFKIMPKNSFSMVVFIISKVLAFLYVANYLFKKLADFLKS